MEHRKLDQSVLRDWFCEEMGKLGVADRYIDAFCGRTPKSVLARYYSDYSPEKLKKIYDKADLKVLAPECMHTYSPEKQCSKKKGMHGVTKAQCAHA